MLLAQHQIFCVNPPPFHNAFEEKCAQLLLAAEVGLNIPPTLYTTRLPLAHEFYHTHGGEIIYKTFKQFVRISYATATEPSKAARVLTNRVAESHLREPSSFIPTPGIFQPYIPKQLELRIVVIGRRLFTCAIHSQHSERSRNDWRRYDLDHTPHTPYDLPDELAQKILRLMERMNLVFGSIDMILTPDGEYIFLEVNPNGQFDWIQHLTGLPLYEHLAQMLIQGTVDYQPSSLPEVPHAA